MGGGDGDGPWRGGGDEFGGQGRHIDLPGSGGNGVMSEGAVSGAKNNDEGHARLLCIVAPVSHFFGDLFVEGCAFDGV